MADSELRVAIDTSVMVNVLTGGSGGHDKPEWLKHGKLLLQLPGQRIVISAIVIAEIGGDGLVRGSNVPAQDRKQRIKVFQDWLNTSRILVVEADRSLAIKANEISAESQMRGADALVLASALAARCTVLYSWDSDHLKCAGQYDIEIRTPDDLHGEPQLPMTEPD